MNLPPPAGSVRFWLERRAAETPDRISHLFPDDGFTLTWRELYERAREGARRLAAAGVRPGESVAVMAPNGAAAVQALFAAWMGGYRATPLNLQAGADAVGYALAHSRAPVVLVEDSQRNLLRDAGALHTHRATPLDLGAEGIEHDGIDALDPVAPDDRSDALLMYTSGTTGRPKGVRHSQTSLLAGGWTVTVAHELDESDRALCVLPLFHINGLCVTLMGPLVSGGAVIVPHRFSASRFWAIAGAHRATWFSVVPTILSHLLHGDRANDPDAATLARLRFGRSASAPLSPDVHRAFEERFGLPLIETMGLTETAAQILSNPLPPGDRVIGSPGRAVGNEVRIADGTLATVPAGTEGEVLVRGPNVMRGYLDNPEATAEALSADGWLRTGDLGRMDGDGFVTITGRIKELIIKGGENIAPREVDDALYALSDVIEAAAFPVDCPRYGQDVEAAVVLEAASGHDEDSLRAHCEHRLGRLKTPRRIHLLDDLPKGPSGKILRLKLAEEVAQSSN